MKFFKTLRDSNIGPGAQYIVRFKDPILGEVYCTKDEVFTQKDVKGYCFPKNLHEVEQDQVPRKTLAKLVESVEMAGWEHRD